MSLTGLFSAPAQTDVFLWMACLGAALGGLARLLAWIHHRFPRAAWVGDVLFALCCAGGVLWVLLTCGQGTLRLYALLGAGLGLLLWLTGPDAALRLMARRRARRRAAAKEQAEQKAQAAEQVQTAPKHG